MKIPFTIAEVRKAVSKLKLGKSPGCDDIPVEIIKYAPDMILQHITDIFNQIASNSECPKEINHGILIPLQKPGKLRGPVVNLCPIILLSTIRKILAVVMMGRIGEKKIVKHQSHKQHIEQEDQLLSMSPQQKQ